MQQSLIEAAHRLETWITKDALPLWQRLGTSPDQLGHYEHLTNKGQPDLYANIRVRVQARQAFVYAFSSHRGWCDGEVLARQLLNFAEERTAHPTAGAGFTHLLDKNFDVIDTRQDFYDHTFFVLAYTWCYRAFRDPKFLAQAETLVAHLDTHFMADFGGWAEGDYPHEHRRQNPHMHMFEALLSLYDATGDSRWLARVGEIFSLFETRFYDPGQQVLFEFFKEDWRLSPGPAGQQVEPGHMVEWVWLLDWYHRRSGRPVERYTRALYSKALTLGQSASGLLYDAVRADGELITPTKRCWGLTELIKASLVRARAGDLDAEARAARAISNLFDYYLCAETPGSYIDQRGAQDEIVVDTAPASTLYHLVVLVAEVQDYVQSQT